MPVTLITGGAGFLGSHLCERMLAEGHDVVCVDNFLTGRRENVEHLLDRDDFRLIEHDITKTWVHVETNDRFCAPRSVQAMPDIDSIW